MRNCPGPAGRADATRSSPAEQRQSKNFEFAAELLFKPNRRLVEKAEQGSPLDDDLAGTLSKDKSAALVDPLFALSIVFSPLRFAASLTLLAPDLREAAQVSHY